MFNPKNEKDLDGTVKSALRQINEKNYASAFVRKGIPEDHIREYGFAFEGKKVLIDGGGMQRVRAILEAPYNAERGYRAMVELAEASQKNGLSDMSLDEINAEIEASRNERKTKNSKI